MSLRFSRKFSAPCPEGVHTARCYQVVDLGTQRTNFGDKPQIWVGWEVLTEVNSYGEPFTVGRRYTASLSKKSALARDLESWIGFVPEPFNPDELVGQACRLKIAHQETSQGRTYAKVVGIHDLLADDSVPDAVNDSVIFDMDRQDTDSFTQLPEWLQKEVEKAPEFEPPF